MSAIRVLHLQSSFGHGGKERRTAQLMNAFGDAARHVILSALPGADAARALIDRGVAVVIEPPDAPSLVGWPSAGRYHRLARYMQDFDLVLSYNWGAMDGVMAHTLFARAYDLPPLVHHEDGFNADEAGRLKRRRNWFRMVALGKAAALVVPSARLETVARNVWRQPPGRIHRIPNGIDVARYDRKAQRGSFPGFIKREGDIVVGTLAALRPVKNFPLLMRAVAAAGPHVRLAIAGEGPERAALEALGRDLGLGDRLMMPGHIADPARILPLFDIYGLSSDSEQAPIALVEAMAAGLPVAATDVGDVATMVSSANAAHIVPPGDGDRLAAAIGALAGDAALRGVIGAANRARAAAEFNEERMIARYRLLYGGIMGRADFARQ